MVKMTLFFRACILLLLFLFISSAYAGVDYSLDVNISGGHTDNLFKDTSTREETFSVTNVSVNIYPVSVAEINLIGEFTYYSELIGLSNFLYGAGITIIPTGDSSKTSLYINTNFRGRKYREESLDVTTTDFDAKDLVSLISLGHELSPAFRLRTGFSFKMTGFENDAVNDKFVYELFAGSNLTFLGANSLDIEAGFNTGNYDYLVDSTRPYVIRSPNEYSSLTEGVLKSYYISPRFSRTLSEKIGMNLVFSHRKFINRDEKAIIYGYSTGLLSPWSSDYEGQAVLLSFKNYIIPNIIITGKFGYWDKNYLKTMEKGFIFDPFLQIPVPFPDLSTFFAQKRHDIQRRVSLNLQFPIPSHSGIYIEPSLQIEYIDNNSSIDVYNYSNFSTLTSISIRF